MSVAIIDTIDQEVWEFFVDHSALSELAGFVTKFGVASVLLPLAAACGVFVWRSTRSTYHALLPFVSVYTTALVVSSLKDWTDTPRPPREFWLSTAESASFPSGHVGSTTAFFVAMYIVVTRTYPHYQRIAMSLAVIGSLAMGWTRLALNVHWFSDVVGGFIVGIAVTFAVTRIFDGVRSRRESQPQTPG